MNQVLDAARSLNAMLPNGSLRRNVVEYEYVTYINHIIALFLTERYDDSVLFISRALSAEEKLKKHKVYNEEYFSHSKEFIKLVLNYTIQNNILGEFGKAIVKDYKLEKTLQVN